MLPHQDFKIIIKGQSNRLFNYYFLNTQKNIKLLI